MQYLRGGPQFGLRDPLPAAAAGPWQVYNDELIFEQYSAVVDKDSRLIGWSATKSVVNALIGVVTGEGNLQVYDPAPVPEWAGDDRAQITTDEMLSMTSGVPWGVDPLTTVRSNRGPQAHFHQHGLQQHGRPQQLL